MQITMITPQGEMKFDMPPAKAANLVQQAFHYATGRKAKKKFGDFRAAGRTAEQETVPDGEHIRTDAAPDFRRKRKGYNGFLMVKCERCGKVRGFCSKKRITAAWCECGHNTELHDLCPAHLKCKCGSEFTYMTNFTEERFDFPCFHCGSPVDLELNKHGTAYDTIA